MSGGRNAYRLVALLVLIVTVSDGHADTLTVAVASNFRLPAEAIGASFTEATGRPVRLSFASTGKLYAQITNGAPFDVFLAADARHPQLLVQSGRAVAKTRMTYAIGSLVLWSRDPAFASVDCRSALDNLGKRRLAIANPATAPYGVAAKQFLQTAGLWQHVELRLVLGENIAQALQFVATGNAQLGLIAGSQAVDARLPEATCSWPVPESMHEPIMQQAIVLRRAADRAAAAAYIEYLAGDEASAIVRRYGYETAP